MSAVALGTHQHHSGCYREEITCGWREHTHGDTCYKSSTDNRQILTCTFAQHTHGTSCTTKTKTCGLP